jgi:hypothetical protein
MRNEWVNVDDKLPPEGKIALVVDDEFRYDVAFWGSLDPNGVYWARNRFGQSLNMNITHWMPLPDPPHRHEWAILVDVMIDQGEWSQCYYYQCPCGLRIENNEIQEALTEYIDG